MTDEDRSVDWTDAETFRAILDRVETRELGHYFEFFETGDEIEHDPGVRLARAGNEQWMSQTLNHDPAYWRSDAARERGFDEPPIHPDYLLACVMGPSVEDLSEKGGYFLGRTDVEFRQTAYPGTEVHVRSTVAETRPSSSRPEYGIVTWRTEGYDADSGDVLVSYERTNMVPRRTPAATDGGNLDEPSDGQANAPALPETFLTPDGECFEDFRTALDRAADEGAAVAYRHERGRTMDDTLVAGLPLATLNTARQHHTRDEMAGSPSGDIVAYGDVTRSIALGHARSDEATYRERRVENERFHDFVTLGDTIYGFTRVLDADGSAGPSDTGAVRFQHVAFDQDRSPVYSGERTALIRREDSR
jgi:2-methylfumaryl-CoA hydratase